MVLILINSRKEKVSVARQIDASDSNCWSLWFLREELPYATFVSLTVNYIYIYHQVPHDDTE